MATVGDAMNKIGKIVMWLTLGVLGLAGVIIAVALITAEPDPMADVHAAPPSFSEQVISAYTEGNNFTRAEVIDGMRSCKGTPTATESYEKLDACIRAYIDIARSVNAK